MLQISRLRQATSLLCISVLLSSCGGGGVNSAPDSSNPAPPVVVTPPPAVTPPTTSACSISARLDWVTARLRDDYLFPDLLATVNPAGYTDVQQYINDMTAPARAAGKDKLNFSYVTSIAEETALTSSGSSAGFGIRLFYEGNRVFISEAFEGAPGLAAGLDRGVEILAIGTSPSTLRNVAELINSTGVSAALGPSDAGVTRTLRIRNTAGVESVITVTKADFSLDPVSDRYGSRILTDGGKKVGYVNLRTFIVSNADQQLREVFANFKAQGVTEVIVDLRYNGGGLVSLAETLTNLLGGNRTSSDVQSKTVFNQRLSSNNKTTFFAPQSQSIAPTGSASWRSRPSTATITATISTAWPARSSAPAAPPTTSPSRLATRPRRASRPRSTSWPGARARRSPPEPRPWRSARRRARCCRRPRRRRSMRSRACSDADGASGFGGADGGTGGSPVGTAQTGAPVRALSGAGEGVAPGPAGQTLGRPALQPRPVLAARAAAH
jgi:hypothetical protein